MENATKIQRVYPLSPMQEGMLFASLLQENSTAYVEQVTLSLRGRVDGLLLQKSFGKVIERYDALRTAFIYEKLHKPRQVVLKQRNIDLHLQDISSLGELEKQLYLENFKREDRERGFDLAKDPLLRAALIKTAEDLYRLVLSFHHTILDGWCIGIILNNLLQAYRSLQNGEPLATEPAVPYENYITWLSKQNKEESLRYWQKYLEGYERQVTLPRIGETWRFRAIFIRFRQRQVGPKDGKNHLHEFRLSTDFFRQTVVALMQFFHKNRCRQLMRGSRRGRDLRCRSSGDEDPGRSRQALTAHGAGQLKDNQRSHAVSKKSQWQFPVGLDDRNERLDQQGEAIEGLLRQPIFTTRQLDRAEFNPWR